MREVLLELNDGWSSQHFQEGDLVASRLFVFGAHVVQVDLLQRIQFLVNDVFVKPDLARGSLAQWLLSLVLGQARQLLRLVGHWLGSLTALLHLLAQRAALLDSDRFNQIVGCAELCKTTNHAISVKF